MSYLGIEVARIGIKGKVEPHAKRVAPGGRDVRVDIRRFDPRVLHPGDAAGGVIVGRRTECRHPYVLVALRHHGGQQVHSAPLAQRAEHGSVLAVRDLTEYRIRGLRRDARALQRDGIAPHGVVVPCSECHRPIGHRGVEPVGVEQSVGRETAVIGGADDPFVVRMLGGEFAYDVDDFVNRIAGPHRRSGVFEAAVQRMGVTVAERRHQEAAVKVDLVGVRGHGSGLLTQRPHHSIDDQQRIGIAGRAGPDHAAGEDRRGHQRDPTPMGVT